MGASKWWLNKAFCSLTVWYFSLYCSWNVTCTGPSRVLTPMVSSVWSWSTPCHWQTLKFAHSSWPRYVYVWCVFLSFGEPDKNWVWPWSMVDVASCSVCDQVPKTRAFSLCLLLYFCFFSSSFGYFRCTGHRLHPVRGTKRLEFTWSTSVPLHCVARSWCASPRHAFAQLPPSPARLSAYRSQTSCSNCCSLQVWQMRHLGKLAFVPNFLIFYVVHFGNCLPQARFIVNLFGMKGILVLYMHVSECRL